MKKEWVIKKVEGKPNSVLEKLLQQRGIVKPEDIWEYLNPSEFKVISPYVFCDMRQVVDRIKHAVDNGEKILIYGDFDADGITSTSLLIKTFEHLGADVDYFIPQREKHGHGLNFSALVGVMAKRKPKLIITVDCGISNLKEVEQLKAFGVETIITDHHEAPEELPVAVGIINPKAPYKLDESLSTKEIVSLTSLAGVGVAFKLASALLAEYDKNDFVLEILPFVALGTISDIVPLVYENRLLVTRGLELIANNRHYGLTRLLEEAGCKIENGVTSEQIAFGVTPRINASGRLENVDDSVKVLISDNKKEIELAIMSLNNCNKIRQELCENMFLEAKDMRQDENAIILFNKDWHIGIVGIVASKLVEAYHKPTFLMTYSEETKQIRCSARSVDGVNIYEVLNANSELFDNFGGHTMAGGFGFSVEKHSFEEVKKALNSTINEILGSKKLTPKLTIDLELSPDEVTMDLVSDINRLEPFGAENPSPIFAMYNLKLLQKRLIGTNKNHLKLLVEDPLHNTYDCLWWSKGDISVESGDTLDLAFALQQNTYNGNTTLQFIICDMHSDKLVEQEPTSQYTIYDHRKKTGILSNVEDYLKTTKLKIGVFAESIEVIDSFKTYPQIYERKFTRTKIEKFDAIMFFDYPASQELLDEILEKSGATVLHFMNFESKTIDEREYLRIFSGLIKYSCSHYEGGFNIRKAASRLAITNEAVIETLDALESVEIIEITERAEDTFCLKLLEQDFSKVLHSEHYAQLLTEQKLAQDFKASLSGADLNMFIPL